MQKVVEIDGISVPFKATASTTRRYRERFCSDLLADMQTLARSLGDGTDLSSANLVAFENIAYTMAKQADPSIPDDPSDWLDQFGIFSIYQVMPQLVELWGMSCQTIEEPKKK